MTMRVGIGSLWCAQVERLARQLLVDAFDLVHHAARLDDGDPALDAALAVTHAGLGRLLGDGLSGKMRM